jgi:hypothetical protein
LALDGWEVLLALSFRCIAEQECRYTQGTWI